MKLPAPPFGTPPAAKRPGARGDDPSVSHPSVMDFNDGVEVTEVDGTLPGELWDLFPTPPAPERR